MEGRRACQRKGTGIKIYNNFINPEEYIDNNRFMFQIRSGVNDCIYSSRDRTAGRFRSLFIAGTVSSSQTIFSTFLYKNLIADR